MVSIYRFMIIYDDLCYDLVRIQMDYVDTMVFSGWLDGR